MIPSDKNQCRISDARMTVWARLVSCPICGKKCKSNHILYLYQFIHVKIGMWQSYFRDFIKNHFKIIHQKLK